MAFNFPSGATNGQQYTADNGVVYVFDGTKWNIKSTINNYAITGSNTFTGSQYITGSVEVYSDNWPEIRLINGDTGIQYHLQNTAGGNFSIHNDTIGASTLRIDSASSQGDSHVHIFGDLYVQSGSIFSISGSHGYVRALSMVETPKIIGTGSITIQPDPNDTRDVQIYNTAPSDIHIKGNATYTFFGDDTNFLKIDNINSTITIDSTNGLFIDTPVDIKGNQIVSGSIAVLISGNAFGVNENPTPNNIFWSYIPNDTNTTSIESGWIVNVETVGTYNVTNVEYDYPFVKITLSDALLQLPYRCNGYFSLPSSELKFGTDGVLKISGSLSVSGSITGSTNFNTIVNKPTLISGSSQLTSSLDTRYAASGSAPTLFLLEAYANETYTLPGGFTEDPCRYSVVSVNENVPSNWFNTSTYRFTPQKAGYWEINACYDVYRNSESSMAIRKNGSIVASAGSFNAVAQQVIKIVYLNGSTDYIDIVNTGGGTLQRYQYQQRSWFQAKWIGE